MVYLNFKFTYRELLHGLLQTTVALMPSAGASTGNVTFPKGRVCFKANVFTHRMTRVRRKREWGWKHDEIGHKRIRRREKHRGQRKSRGSRCPGPKFRMSSPVCPVPSVRVPSVWVPYSRLFEPIFCKKFQVLRCDFVFFELVLIQNLI